MWIYVDICISFTLRFKSTDLCNHRDHTQIVKIGVLEIYRLLSPTLLLSSSVALDEGKDKVT